MVRRKRPTYYAVQAYGEIVSHYRHKRDAIKDAKGWRKEGKAKVIPRYGDPDREGTARAMHRELYGGHYRKKSKRKK